MNLLPTILVCPTANRERCWTLATPETLRTRNNLTLAYPVSEPHGRGYRTAASRSVDTCQRFSVVRISPWAGVINYDQPVTAAIFGLIGVVVGGLLNGAVTAWQARRTDAFAARVGARLFDLELRQAALALAVLEDEESVASGKAALPEFSTAAWDKYQEVLARTLSDKDWLTSMIHGCDVLA
jgi:hypothetical protein